ncbi:MAG: histidinol dehydrogenase [Ignavibacteriae bacterium]|nr:histidinol dehydrogenase [Ignavibacteriota bacterium]NOH00263.1 histidinol dehydrogenase [Ignavibacteriota bacterium]
MKTYFYNKLSKSKREQLLKRSAVNFEGIYKIVKPILMDVKKNGLTAAIKYSNKFDGATDKNLLVNENDINNAHKFLSADVKRAIKNAFKNIYKFHKEQVPTEYIIETQPGVTCSRKYLPIESVGLYIPGGTAVLPSTLLMLGIPALIAGCKRIIVCSPPNDNQLHPAILYTANLLGIKELYKIGGAQAVGLMAFGDEKIQKVNKIFGPGNQFVTAAKNLVSIDPDGCAIDMPAGPSELLVIADNSANPKFVAADLLSQAEHGNDSQVILLTDEIDIAKKVIAEVKCKASKLDRKNIVKNSLKNSFIVVTENIEQAINFSNEYAPEHLILSVSNIRKYEKLITNAGSLFLGNYSPESAGDYASGTNHSLPTSCYAKTFGGVTVESFMKSMTTQRLTKSGLKDLSETIITLAELEKLDAHANAVKVRI